jgi:type III pantothenate kinase
MIFNLYKTIIKKNLFVCLLCEIYFMILAVDIGNTRTKAAVFQGSTLLDSFVFLKIELQKSVQNILNKHKNISHLVVSSVSDVERQVFISFRNDVEVHFVSHQDNFPFVNCYETPQTLGVDRMVLATGASLKYPNKNILVIDAGTCVTYDFVDEQNNYLGGAISPGLKIRYDSLHNYTARLPLLTPQIPQNLIGNSTAESIHAGIVNGLVFEIDGYIEELRAKYPKFIIILTGGDTVFLAKRLKNAIFADSNFLLECLNYTYLYKIKNG